jgi:hypothetical protein
MLRRHHQTDKISGWKWSEHKVLITCFKPCPQNCEWNIWWLHSLHDLKTIAYPLTYQACWHSDSAYHLWTKCVKHTLNVIHDWIFVNLDVFVLPAMNVTYVRLPYEFFLIFKMYIFMVGYKYRFLATTTCGKTIKTTYRYDYPNVVYLLKIWYFWRNLDLDSNSMHVMHMHYHKSLRL